jgi:hypothetical protein
VAPFFKLRDVFVTRQDQDQHQDQEAAREE